MKFRKLNFITIILLLSFVISTTNSPAVTPVNAQIETNFSPWLFTNTGNRLREGYANYIKTALAPLGIDVKVIAKPFGQFVGDLLHFTTGHPFDLAIVGFTGGQNVNFIPFYHSQGTFGYYMYQLADPTWQAWQLQDTGINQTSYLDPLIEAHDFEVDPVTKQEKTDFFAQLYMDKLLFQFPLVSGNSLVAAWAGFGGAANENWDPDEGFLGSAARGAKWESNPSIRAANSNTSTYRFRHVVPPKDSFSRLDIFDTATAAITNIMVESLLSFDKNADPHPGVAYNYFVEDATGDWDNNASTPATVSRNGRWTFFVGDQSYWAETVDKDGNTIPTTKVTAADFMFTLQALKMTNIIANGQEDYEPLFDFNLTTTVTTDDTLNIYIEEGGTTLSDIFNYGGLDPLPTHILNKTLTWTDGATTVTGTPAELDAQGINPQETLEWKNWASEAGHSWNGQYELVENKVGEFRSYRERSDYWYPNEWDSASYYGDGSAFAAIEAAAENLTDGDLGRFAPHVYDTAQEPYYWGFADDASTTTVKEKPTASSLPVVFITLIEDSNSALFAFEQGTIDLFTSSSIGAQKVEDHRTNPDMIVKPVRPSGSPAILVFNLLHPDLKKINVRKAIGHAIDLDELVKVADGFAVPNESPVYVSQFKSYKPFPLGYSYETARDLMRSEGYVAEETNVPVVAPPRPPVGTVVTTISEQLGDVVNTVTDVVNVTDSVGTNLYFAFAGIALLVLTVFRKKKRII